MVEDELCGRETSVLTKTVSSTFWAHSWTVYLLAFQEPDLVIYSVLASATWVEVTDAISRHSLFKTSCMIFYISHHLSPAQPPIHQIHRIQ